MRPPPLDGRIVVSGRTYVKSMSPPDCSGHRVGKNFHTPCNLYAYRLHLDVRRLHSREAVLSTEARISPWTGRDIKEDGGTSQRLLVLMYGNDFERPGH